VPAAGNQEPARRAQGVANDLDEGTDSMTGRRRRCALAFTAALGSAALLAPQVQAAPTKVKSGRTVLTISTKGNKALKRRHIEIRAAGRTRARKRAYRSPVRSGRFNFETNRGTLNQAGGLRLRRGRRKLAIRAVKVRLGRKSRVVARIGRRKVAFAVLSRRAQKVHQSGNRRTVSRIRVRPSKRAAKLIRRKLGGKRLSPRRTIASLRVTVRRPSGSTGAPPAGTPGAGDSATTGSAKISFAPGLAELLGQAGLDLSALPGADQLPDGTIDLPVAAVNIDPQTGEGTIDLDGGLSLGNGDNAVKIEDPQVVLSATEAGLYAWVAGVRIKVAALEDAGLGELLRDGATQIEGTVLTLAPQAAELFSQLGGVSLFVPGTPFGDLSLTLPSS
jgi:hypothetical protein